MTENSPEIMASVGDIKPDDQDTLTQLPAILVNRFFVQAGSSVVRLSFGENSRPHGQLNMRACICMGRDEALLLAQLLVSILTAPKSETQTNDSDTALKH